MPIGLEYWVATRLERDVGGRVTTLDRWRCRWEFRRRAPTFAHASSRNAPSDGKSCTLKRRDLISQRCVALVSKSVADWERSSPSWLPCRTHGNPNVGDSAPEKRNSEPVRLRFLQSEKCNLPTRRIRRRRPKERPSIRGVRFHPCRKPSRRSERRLRWNAQIFGRAASLADVCVFNSLQRARRRANG